MPSTETAPPFHALVLAASGALVASMLACEAKEQPSSKPEPLTVAPPPPAPIARTVRAARGKVVVRTTKGLPGNFDGVSVRCLQGERLVGGGCGGGCLKAGRNAPFAFGADDTEAAGWECVCHQLEQDVGTWTFALCEGMADGDAGP